MIFSTVNPSATPRMSPSTTPTFKLVPTVNMLYMLYSSLSSYYNDQFLILRDYFINMTSHIQTLMESTNISLLPSFKCYNLFQKNELLTTSRNVPSILSVESPYIQSAGNIISYVVFYMKFLFYSLYSYSNY